MENNYKDFLKQYDDEWKQAEPQKDEYAPLPDDKYQVNIETARIEQNDEFRVFLKWGLRVLTGKYQKRLIFKRNSLDNPEKFGWLKADLSKVGFELEKISDLEELLPHLLDRVIEVNLKTSTPNAEGKTYQNCYFRKFIGPLNEFLSENGLAGIDLNGMPF
jgi:hypothetical protein